MTVNSYMNQFEADIRFLIPRDMFEEKTMWNIMLDPEVVGLFVEMDKVTVEGNDFLTWPISSFPQFFKSFKIQSFEMDLWGVVVDKVDLSESAEVFTVDITHTSKLKTPDSFMGLDSIQQITSFDFQDFCSRLEQIGIIQVIDNIILNKWDGLVKFNCKGTGQSYTMTPLDLYAMVKDHFEAFDSRVFHKLLLSFLTEKSYLGE